MPPVIKGKDVLSALNELKTPSKLNEIVEHMSAKCEASKTALTAAVKTILDVGVQHGYIEESEDRYHTEYKPSEEPKVDQVPTAPNETNTQGSAENVEVSRNKEKPVENKRHWTISHRYFLNSSDDEDENEAETEELRDQGDCCGSRYRRRSRSRSRSGRHGKSSRRRTRRRRRE